MNKSNSISIKSIFYTTGIIGILLIMLIKPAFSFELNNKSYMLDNFQYRWGDSPFTPDKKYLWTKNQENNKWKNAYQLNNLPERNLDNTIWFKVKLPKYNFVDPSIYILYISEVFEVYLEDKLIYKYGNPNPENYQFLGYPGHIIPLTKNSSGKTLYFRIYSNDPTIIGIHNNIKLAEHSFLMMNLIHHDLARLILGLLSVLIGILSLTFFISRKFEKIYITFTILSLAIGLYNICGTDINLFFFDAPLFVCYLEIISLYFGVTFLSLFIEQDTLSDVKIMKIFLIVNSLYATLSVLFSLLNIVPLMLSLQPFQALFSFEVLVILYYLIKNISKKDDIKILLAGFIPIGLTGIIDAMVMAGMIPEFESYEHWTIFFFNICLVYIFGVRFINIQKLMNTYSDDLDLQKRLQEQLILAKEAAVEATNSKSSFLANMSHEIRTPINGVIGMTSLLMDTKLTNEQFNYINSIKHSGNTLLNLINDILDFSKLEAGKMQLENNIFDLFECIEETLEIISFKSSEKNLQLFYYIESNVKQYVCGDSLRLKQVLMNLLSNSVKFTQTGEISLLVSLKSENNNSYNIEFSIHDTGIGIAPDQIEKLFKSFSQVDGSISRKFGGTGLGLAISKDFIELMDGEITVSSKERVGSVFTFEINLKKVKENIIEKYSNTRNIENKNVIIFAKESNYIKYLDKQLSNWKINSKVLEIENDKTISNSNCDLIIFDANSYLDNLKEINQQMIDKNLPVIYLKSLHEHKEKDLSIKDKSFFREINLPIKYTQLFDLINNIFNPHLKIEKIIKSEFLNLATEHPLQILIAEDNEINQKLITGIMNKFGYKITLANNGLEVIRLIDETDYDIIFMDIQMPDMDGLETTKFIKANNLCCNTKIIAMTANVMAGDKERCIEAGMDDYISKPLKIDNIKNILIKYSAIIKENNLKTKVL